MENVHEYSIPLEEFVRLFAHRKHSFVILSLLFDVAIDNLMNEMVKLINNAFNNGTRPNWASIKITIDVMFFLSS